MKIYITYTKEDFSDSQISALKNVGEVVFLEQRFSLKDAPYIKDDSEKILVVDPDWYDWNIDANHLSQVNNLKGICLSTTAFDWIDMDYCNEKNIIVSNIPKYSTDSVAEYGIFLMMCLAKKLPYQIKDNYKLDYSKQTLNTELYGKTVGIIGLGTIGKRIADICNAFGMNIIYWNRTNKDNSYRQVDLETIFSESDFIFPTFVTNDETKKLITDDLINSMKNCGFINVINNSREIYNHDLMLKKAQDEDIAYAFELYDNDKTLNDYTGNIMATSPYAFYTTEAIGRLVSIWCDNIIMMVKNNPQNIVNKGV